MDWSWSIESFANTLKKSSQTYTHTLTQKKSAFVLFQDYELTKKKEKKNLMAVKFESLLWRKIDFTFFLLTNSINSLRRFFVGVYKLLFFFFLWCDSRLLYKAYQWFNYVNIQKYICFKYKIAVAHVNLLLN